MLMNSAEPRPHEDNKQLSFIKAAAEEMREMVNDLLDLAKVEAGKITISPTEFDLDFVFRALRGMFRPLLQTDDTLLIFDDTSAVPSIYSDEAKVSQILRNFISNALKFTEKGEIHVWAKLADDGLRISVSDTGIGVSPEYVKTIFDEYSQVEGPLQKRVKGTGLGLPLCKKFAELLGGAIEVESELGKGSTFTLVLPTKYEAQRRFAGSIGVGNEPKLPKLLIVDDMEIDRYLLIHLLKSGGNYNILQASDGRTGLDLALSELPDMIFLDLNMPKLDGFGVLAALRENFSTAKIPVVIVTTRVLSQADLNSLKEMSLTVLSKEALSSAEKVLLELLPNARIEVVAASGEIQNA
jgi:CheY-like chemotaxis protein/anti-sigma regulatory factor (Ser/Thr protein kinase)